MHAMLMFTPLLDAAAVITAAVVVLYHHTVCLLCIDDAYIRDEIDGIGGGACQERLVAAAAAAGAGAQRSGRGGNGHEDTRTGTRRERKSAAHGREDACIMHQPITYACSSECVHSMMARG